MTDKEDKLLTAAIIVAVILTLGCVIFAMHRLLRTETEFVVPFVKEHHRTPTFSDAIEMTRKQMIEKATKWIEYYNNNGGCLFDGWKDDFIKAMEE